MRRAPGGFLLTIFANAESAARAKTRLVSWAMATTFSAVMTVDIEKLETLLDVLREQGVAEFEHEADGVRVRIVRGQPRRDAEAAGAAALLAQAAAPTRVEAHSDTIDITSPFVGTFYRSPSPEASVFCEVGSVVKPGQTLCIIEAMKLMNEIESEVSGTITEVFAQNGKSVEFGQPLFRIKKA